MKFGVQRKGGDFDIVDKFLALVLDTAQSLFVRRRNLFFDLCWSLVRIAWKPRGGPANSAAASQALALPSQAAFTRLGLPL